MTDNNQLTADVQSNDMSEMVFSTLMDAVANPDLDADKMEKLLDMQLRLIDRQKKEEFEKSLAAACFEMPTITRRGAIKNKQGRIQSRYSKWSDLQSVVYPILRKNGLLLRHDIDSDNGRVIVQLIMSHINGHTERGGKSSYPIDNTGSKSPTQGVGSSASYGQRHTTIKYLGIQEMDASDDDGRGGASVEVSLTVDEKRIIADGEQATLKGMESYSAWYKSQTNTVRGWLVDNEHHAALKERAGS